MTKHKRFKRELISGIRLGRIYIPATHRFLFYLFLVLIPVQVRYIFYAPDWRFSEWQSMSLYMTDVVFGFLVLFWMIENFGAWRDIKMRQLRRSDYALGALLAIAAVSVLFSSEQIISLYTLVKFTEMVVLYLYIRHYAVRNIKPELAAWMLVIGGLFQAVLGILQFVRQSDLGLWFLGEGVLGANMRGVAVFLTESGQRIMRAYGTLPHPNILAAYLLISLFAVCYLFLKKNVLRSAFYVPCFMSHVLILWGFLLAFSRTAIFVWVMGMLAWAIVVLADRHLRSAYRKRIMGILIITLLAVAAFAVVLWPEVMARMAISSNEEAVSMRIFYSGQALDSGGWLINVAGVGIGNFVNWFTKHSPGLAPYLYQPVHNIYLLVYVEMGIFGFLALIVFIGILIWEYWRVDRTKTTRTMGGAGFLVLVGAFLFIGFFDHFPWTLQQGRLMLWGILGLMAGITDGYVA